jgi:hypothetical protein
MPTHPTQNSPALAGTPEEIDGEALLPLVGVTFWSMESVPTYVTDIREMTAAMPLTFFVVVARGWHGRRSRSDPAQYGRTVPLTVVRSISRRWSEGKSSRTWLEHRLSQTRRLPTRQTWR